MEAELCVGVTVEELWVEDGEAEELSLEIDVTDDDWDERTVVEEATELSLETDEAEESSVEEDVVKGTVELSLDVCVYVLLSLELVG